MLVARDGRWTHAGEPVRARGRDAGCSAPTPSSRPSTGPSARTARSRGSSRRSTCPTWARACSPPPCAWTRCCSRTSWRRPACRRCRTGRCARAIRSGRVEALGLPPVREARTPRLVRGHLARRGRGGPAGGARPRLDARPARHRRGPRARDGGRVLGARQRRSRGLGAGGDRDRRASGTTTRRSTRRAGWSCAVPARLPAEVRERVRSLAVEAFVRVGCAGLARVRLLRRGGRAGARQRAQHDARLHRDERVRRSCSAASGIAYPELLDRLVGLALERHARERAYRF